MALRFVSYKSKHFPGGVVGIADASGTRLQALSFPSGQPVVSVYDLVEEWDKVASDLRPVPGVPLESIQDVQIQAPLTGRDVLAVGKNYKDHAREFQQSGFDSSDKNEQPDFPVIFTKRASSIIPNGHPVYPHPKFTDTLDYEGELGVIIGKGGIGIKKEDAWKHVWGAVILNDVTARERQRDHKQFFIGKSLDTFCPMGTYAVHTSSLDWDNMQLITKINDQVRQSQYTKDLIFDIPTLIETISAGITMMPGDVIATGTPAGVGIGKKPPIYLKTGDKMEICITGLGTLTNVIADGSQKPVCDPVRPSRITSVVVADSQLVKLPSGQMMHIEDNGFKSTDAPLIFIHGLGGASTSFFPLLKATGLLETRRVVLADWEGHGLSPLTGSEELTVEALARSYLDVLDLLKIDKAVIVGHSLGGLIASYFASEFAERVSQLILIGPVKRIGPPGVDAMVNRAKQVRDAGMTAIVSPILSAGLSANSQKSNYMAQGLIKTSLLATNPEGYAKACLALASFQSELDYSQVKSPTLIIAGDEDKTCPEATVSFLQTAITGSKVETLKGIGHWHMLEDVEGVAVLVQAFLA